MPARIEPFQDSAAARAELIPFLERSFRGEGSCTADLWHRRLVHWWDDNPFAKAQPHRGWELRDGKNLVGYMGVIPAEYMDASQAPLPALIATSWAIDEGHRNSALAMGLRFCRQGQEHLLIDTTPSPQVQAMLQHRGWTNQRQIRRKYLLRALAGRLGAMALPAHLRILDDPRLVTAIGGPENGAYLRKHITPEYLRWYAASPMRRHRFLAVVDASGVLSSYLMVTPQSIRGVPAWSVVDWFTIRADSTELHALVAALARHPPGWPGRWWPLLSVAAFPPDDCWHGLPAVYERVEQVCHFHWLPPHLRDQPRRTVLAEGDWGL